MSLEQLQLLEQQLRQVVQQKNQFKRQEIEIDHAIEALADTNTAYSIVGSVMVQKTPDTLKTELTEKKSLVEQRLSQAETQEEKLRNQVKELQEQLVGEENESGSN